MHKLFQILFINAALYFFIILWNGCEVVRNFCGCNKILCTLLFQLCYSTKQLYKSTENVTVFGRKWIFKSILLHLLHHFVHIAFPRDWWCIDKCGHIQVLMKHGVETYSFHWHVQNATIPCRSQDLPQFLSVTFSCHYSPPTILPSSLTSSCHLFLGLPLSLVPKFIYYTLGNFLPFSVHAQTSVI